MSHKKLVRGTSTAGDIFDSVNGLVDLADQNNIGSRVTKGIIISGSSITWGDGTLEGAYCSNVLADYIKSELSRTVDSNDMVVESGATSTVYNSIMYKGEGIKVDGIGGKVSFSTTGDEVAICFARLRTEDFGVYRISADGVPIGEFDNRNKQVHGVVKSFDGNGVDILFKLDYAATYAHVIKVGGVTLVGGILANTYGLANVPDAFDYVIIRKLNDIGKPIHFVWFKNPPVTGVGNIVVTFSHGKFKGHELSSLGQLHDNPSINESAYGSGYVSYDPSAPSFTSSGLEFRAIDRSQFFIHKFNMVAVRAITVEIIAGTNPYMILDHATNKFHNFMNAGIGGWSVNQLTNNDKVNDYPMMLEVFTPDIIVNESATNDDLLNGGRLVSRTITGVTQTDFNKMRMIELSAATWDGANYTVVKNTGLIAEVTTTSITSSSLVGITSVVDKIMRVGSIDSIDNRSSVVRKVATHNTTTGVITWVIPLNPNSLLCVENISDLVGWEFTVRSFDAYVSLYMDFINKVRKVSPLVHISLVNAGLSNYGLRQLWGYDLIHEEIAAKVANTSVIDVTKELLNRQINRVTGAESETVVANGAGIYQLTKTGHVQGARVLVGGIDVYGVDCYIKSGKYYANPPTNVGSDADFVTAAYPPRAYTLRTNMELVFVRNTPTSGVIVVQYEDDSWSTDHAHLNDEGSYIFGASVIDLLQRKV